jgi:hypothetical protein
LFTREEAEAIRKEYDFKDRLLEKAEDASSSIFTEHNLDTTENGSDIGLDLSKSTILAPFNTPEAEEKLFIENLEENMQSKKVVKFSSKIREFDRRYERDNNSQLDNGVYVQAINDLELPKSSNRKSKAQPSYYNSKVSTLANTQSLFQSSGPHVVGIFPHKLFIDRPCSH